MGTQPNGLRQMTFTVVWGLQRVPSLKRRLVDQRRSRRSRLRHRTWFEIRIVLPPEGLMACDHNPELFRRLDMDWGEKLSSLNCSTGNFRAALRKGRVSLGHVFAEIFCIWLDTVSPPLGHGHIRFSERFRTWPNHESARTRISLWSSRPFPADLIGGLEYKVADYLNKVMNGEPYELEERITEYIDYRREDGSIPAEGEAALDVLTTSGR